jgi:predicted small metal-binding protein
MAVYEFVCDRMIPGCTYTETSETEKEARKNARRHLEDHHRMEVLDDSTNARINMAVIGIHR